MTRHILIILTSFLLFNCSTNSESDVKITEIYYREPSPQSYGTYKTELLILLSNGQGFRFLDDRPSSLITLIIADKLSLLSESEFKPSIERGTSKVQKINVDYTNFILVVNDPSQYNQILKCHYNKDSKELKFKKYVIDHGDTLNILEPNSDTSGVYYFKIGNSSGPFVNLSFPNPDKISTRDITNEQISKKPSMSFEQEIANYVQFQKNPIKPNLFEPYEIYHFALKLVERGPNGHGGEYGYSIEILEDFAFINFSSDVENKLTFQINRKLLPTEISKIKDAMTSSKIDCKEYALPQEINGYRCGHTQLILKNGGKRIAGGILFPLTISGSLARCSNDMQKIFDGCRDYSSTLEGDYDLVINSTKATFTQLDSLFKFSYPKTK